MAERTELSIRPNDDPLITIQLEGRHTVDGYVFDEENTWEVPKSNLIKYSGFFRRMFAHDWVETRLNKVKLHDSEEHEIRPLMVWLTAGKVVHLRDERIDPCDDYPTPELHQDAVAVFELLDKYDCPDFRPGCLDLIATYAKSGMASDLGWDYDEYWNAADFMSLHYLPLKRINGGSYPTELHSVFAEFWWFFSSRYESSAELDAVIDSDHALSAAVARYYRAKLLAAKRSMEINLGSEFD